MTSFLQEKSSFLRREGPIHAITICINYADFLAETLPKNRAYFKDFYIITEADDTATLELAKQHRCTPILTNKRQANGATFNKAGMIYEAQQIVHKAHPLDWICLLDADILLEEGMASLDTKKLDANGLYGLRRKLYNTQEDFKAGNFIIQNYPSEYVVGYFQMYWNKSKFYPTWSQNCSECDLTFMRSFTKRDKFKNIYCCHLGLTGKNWDGRKTEKWC